MEQHIGAISLIYVPVDILDNDVAIRIKQLYAYRVTKNNPIATVSFSIDELTPYFQDILLFPTVYQSKSIVEVLLSFTKVVDGLYYIK